MRVQPILLLSGLLGLTGCVASEADSNPSLTRDDVAAGKADGDLDALCRFIGAPSGCDLCGELGWYYDGVCDAFCDHADPDCGLQRGVLCAEGFGDGFRDCVYSGMSPTQCLMPDPSYERAYQRACCDDRSIYPYCPHLACDDATSESACLANEGCAWETGPDGDVCTYVGVPNDDPCQAASSETECLAIEGCAWGTGTDADVCTYVGVPNDNLCAIALSETACLEIEGCVWGLGANGYICVYVGTFEL